MTPFDPKKARALVERLEGYTPGPWRVAPTDDTTVICPERTVVAEIDGDYNEPDLWPVMEDNARLIAAAPDLHTALTAALDEIERLHEALTKIANAPSEMTWGEDVEVRYQLGRVEGIAGAALKGDDQ